MVTDSPEMQAVIQQNEAKMEFHYIIKVHGRFDDKKLKAIRKGAVIKGQRFGPFFVSSAVRSEAISQAQHGSFDEESSGQHARYKDDSAEE